MKRFLVVLLTIFSALFTKAQAPALGVTIEDEFKVSDIPEKWKNESAVIIGQKTEYLFSRLAAGRNYSTVVRINEYIHKRIKLQDKNALEKFSQFYYVTMGKDGKATYTIIKANGKEENVDMTSAIEEESDVPSVYKPIFFKLNIKSMKIAVPDLEVGDIIDYTVKSTIDWDMKAEGIGFTPFIFTLSNDYPTLYQQYRFTMADGMKVQYRNYNGAPNLKFDGRASVYGDKESYLSYYLVDKDREKSGDERWSFEFRNEPTVKFRVILLADNDPESKHSLGQATVDRAGLNIDDVYKRYAGAAVYQTPTVNSLVGYATEYLYNKKKAGELKENDDIIRECYYCLRKVFLEMYYKGPVHSDLEKYLTGKKMYKKVLASQKKDESQKEEREDEVRISSVTFATAFRMALAVQGIPAELEVYVPRKLGNWRDAIFMDELDFLMRVKGKKKWYYLDAFNNFDAFATPYSYMEGAEGYSIGYDEVGRYMRNNIPSTTYTDNLDKEAYDVSFTADMDDIKVQRTSTFAGMEKSGHIGAANLDREYLNTDFTRYYNEPSKEKSKKKKGDEAENNDASPEKYIDPDKDERIKNRTELFEKDVKSNFDLDKYESFELIQDGRYGDTALLQYKENFTLKKLISKAGKSYIFEVGKLIGDQIKLEQNELAGRKVDIWIPYARTIENIITVTIPAGYTADGLQELNTSVDNESGSFVSTVTTDGDKLIITTRKIYKKNFDKKEMWPNYVAFLEPAYKFSQLKIVLKKK